MNITKGMRVLTENQRASLIDEQQPQHSAERTHVLCIDHDEDASSSIRLQLEQLGIEVSRTSHGMRGFFLAKTKFPDAIIVDISMAPGEGVYLVECFRRNHETSQIPVIAVTGPADKRVHDKMLALGVQTIFNRPVSCEEVLEAVTSLIDWDSIGLS